MSYILICFLESIIGIMYILLTLVNDRVLSLLNTIYNFNTKVWVIILLCVGGRAMGIHHSFFICLFLVAAVATEDLPASVQGTVLIFFVFALWAVPALWLCDCIDLQSSALARQFVCLVMWFFRINTDACLKVRYLFMYLKTVEVSTQHCWLLSISIFLYKSSSMQGSLLGIWLIWAVLLKVPQKQDVLMRTLLLI